MHRCCPDPRPSTSGRATALALTSPEGLQGLLSQTGDRQEDATQGVGSAPLQGPPDAWRSSTGVTAAWAEAHPHQFFS